MKFIEGLTSRGGHYSPGVIAGGTQQALANVRRILEAAGCRREDVVMCHVYISDMGNWDAVNEVYADFFGAHKPARAVVPTRDLHHGALVEIEAIAEMKE